jgi:hypothetical protein
VSALFAFLGREESSRAPSLDPSTKILMSVSLGEIFIMQAV